MSFTAEGTFPVTITEVGIAPSKFRPESAMDACVQVDNGQGAVDWWRGELSAEIIPQGNNQGRKRADVTLEVLTKLGLPNNDISQLAALVGVQTTATIVAKDAKEGDRKFYNVVGLGGGGGNAPSSTVDPAQAAAWLASIGIGPAPAAAPAQAAPAAPVAPAAPAAAPAAPAQQQLAGMPAPVPAPAAPPFPAQ